jgi:acetyl esterase/lipase
MATGRSVLFVHGGGFVIGSKQMKPVRFLTARLVAAGFAVCSIDYRMVFRGGRIEEGVQDVTDGLRFWRAQASRWSADPNQISVLGISAGATLSLLALGTQSTHTHVNRLVSVFGLYDFSWLTGVSGLLANLAVGSRNEERCKAFSPLFTPQPPCPLMLVHGTHDALVPVAQAHQLAAKREEMGLETHLSLYEQLPHGFFNYMNDTTEQAAADIVSYLNEDVS